MKPEEKSESLSQRSFTGFLWLIGQTGITRILNYAGQLILAWLLLPEVFGLIGLAYSIEAFSTLILKNGIGRILISKQDNWDHLENPAFWYGLLTGLIAAVIMVIVAPFAADFYGNQTLSGLIIVLAIAAPINSLAIVPNAKIQCDLRFELSALIEAISQSSLIILTVILAYFGFGAYSFVIPFLVLNPLKVLILFYLTKPKIRFSLELYKWKDILLPSGFILGNALLNMLVTQGDYLLLGAIYSAEVVGLYVFAYRISVQTFSLFTNNLANILFPALSKLQNEPLRQKSAFIRASSLLTIIAIPASIFIAAIAEPLFHLIFPERWYGAIPYLQVLAIGFSLRPLQATAVSFLHSNGKFREHFIINGFITIIFIAIAIYAARISIFAFCFAAIFPFTVGSLFYIYKIFGLNRELLTIFNRLIMLPLLPSILSYIAIIYLSSFFPETNFSNLIIILLALILFVTFNLYSIKLFDSEIWKELRLIKKRFVIIAKGSLTNQ